MLVKILCLFDCKQVRTNLAHILEYPNVQKVFFFQKAPGEHVNGIRFFSGT